LNFLRLSPVNHGVGQMNSNERIAVIGLGYVGLPVALAFARRYPAIGFDIDTRRVEALRNGEDWTGEVEAEVLRETRLHLTADPEDLKQATFFVVTVPTPIDESRQPDLRPVLSACETIGKAISPGAVVVFESTVYPGVTEEICGPAIARASGLVAGRDFTLGYSPERINPGDREHTLERIVKVVSGQDTETLERVASAYGSVIEAGVHRAPNIKVAEAAKVIENTQRDLNIALMNEIALICQRLDIATRDVLAAAGTKWNFLRFTPGLVGGHCIGVDPYYLTAKAESLGYHPEVILAGRRINDDMGFHIGRELIKLLARRGRAGDRVRVGIFGLTFKEDVPDLRNSRVPDIISELREFAITPMVHDPFADPEQAHEEYGVELVGYEAMQELDAAIIAVPHREYVQQPELLLACMKPDAVVMDIKWALNPHAVPPGIRYWSL